MSQSANLLECQTSTPTTVFSVGPTGDVTASGTITTSGMIRSSSDIVFMPASTITPTINGQVTIEKTSNTSLTFKLKGSDGVVRTGIVVLV